MPLRTGADLGVEQRVGQHTDPPLQNLEILACRVGDLERIGVAEQLGERLQVRNRHRVDQSDRLPVVDLHQTEVRVVRAFAHELGVEGHPAGGAPTLDRGAKPSAGGEDDDRRVRGRSGSVNRFAQGTQPGAGEK